MAVRTARGDAAFLDALAEQIRREASDDDRAESGAFAHVLEVAADEFRDHQAGALADAVLAFARTGEHLLGDATPMPREEN